MLLFLVFSVCIKTNGLVWFGFFFIFTVQFPVKLCCFFVFFVGNRDFAPDDPLEFKSHQWFGASVRSQNDKILVGL